jgi:hypothetical protein
MTEARNVKRVSMKICTANPKHVFTNPNPFEVKSVSENLATTYGLILYTQ